MPTNTDKALYTPESAEYYKKIGEANPGLVGGTDSGEGAPVGLTPIVNRYKTAAQDFASGLPSSPIVSAADQEAIRENYRAQAQKEIDVINKIYEDQVLGAKSATEERVGMERAMGARGGILGSTMGESRISKQKEVGRAEISRIGNEQAAKIQEIQQRADERADIALGLKKQEAWQGATAKLNLLKDVQNQAKEDVKGLAQNKVSLQKLKGNTDYYEQFKNELGMDDASFDLYYESLLPQKEQIKYDSYFKGDNLVMVGQDSEGNITTKTYKSSDLGIPYTADPAFITNDITGESFWYDKNNPQTDADGNLVMKSIGKTKESIEEKNREKPTTIKSGGLIIPESDISAGQSKLDESRGEDRYVNTALYLQMLEAWKKDRGLEQDFFTQYPPKNYLNPNDPTMPNYIKDKLKITEEREF